MIIKVKQEGVQLEGELYVGKTHKPIQDALNYLEENGGGIVKIYPGEYDIQVPIDVPSNVTVSGFYTSTKLIPSFGDSSDIGVLQHVGTYTKLGEGIIIEKLFIGIEGNTRVGRHGIYLNYLGGIKNKDSNKIILKPSIVRNCIIKGMKMNGIYLSNSFHNIVSSNTFNNNGRGVYLGNSHSITITSNRCTDSSYTGVYLNSSSTKNSIVSNKCNDNGSYGIYFSQSSNNSITSNICNDSSSNGIYLASSSNSNTITSNICNNGISIGNSSNNSVSSNTYLSYSSGGSGNITTPNIKH